MTGLRDSKGRMGTTQEFVVGDRVTVRYMGEYVSATVVTVKTAGKQGRKMKEAQYQLALPGVSPLAWYEQHEMAAG